MKSKKALYVLLFIALNLIEWIKDTQNGSVWMIAVNCTGLVMMVMIASAYPLKAFVNRFSGIWTGICIAATAGICFTWREVPVLLWKYVTGAVNVWWIGMVVILLLRRSISGERIKWKWNGLAVLGLLLAVSMIFSASGRVWPVWFLFMFGLFYLTEYSEKDRGALIEGMVDGNMISFVLMQGFAYGFRPYDEVRYKGAFSNCNMMALYYLIIYCMVLLKIHFLKTKGTKKGWIAFWTFGAGALLAFQFMTLCRTAWLSAVAITAAYGILVLRGKFQDTWQKILLKAVGLGVCAIVAFPMVFWSVRWLPTILHRPVWFLEEYSEARVHSFDTADSWKYIEMDEFLNEALGRFRQIFLLLGECDPFVLEAHAQETNALEAHVQEDYAQEPPLLDQSRDWTSAEIRKAIWQAYWKDLNWRGHTGKEGYYQITSDYHSWHAQNLWLQIAYYYGIPAGILFVILTVYMVYFYLSRYRKGKHHSQYGIVPVLVIILYFTFGVLETTWNIGQLIVCLFFLVQHPMFRKEKAIVARGGDEG